MDSVEYVKNSKEMESLRKLCSNLNLDFRVILKSKDGVSTTIGNMDRRDSDEILAANVSPEPQVISLPDLPYCYEELFLAEHQYEMVKFVLKLVQLYIGTQGVLGEGYCSAWTATIPRNILPSKLNKTLGKCKNISEESFRLEDLYKYESLRGKVNFVTKPSGVNSKVAWNSFLKIVIHAIYYVNDKDVRTHTFEALSTRPSTSKKRSSEASESGDKEPVPDPEHHDHQEVLREDHDHVNEDVFVDASIEAVEPEPAKKVARLSSNDMFGPDSPPEASPAKKVARLSSHDMFGPDSPPVASTNLLTPLFEIGTNSGNTCPQTVRLQILEIVGTDKFGYIDLIMSDGQHWAHFKTPKHTKKYFFTQYRDGYTIKKYDVLEIKEFTGSNIGDIMMMTSFHKSTVIAGGVKIGNPLPYRSDCVTARGEKEYLEDMSFIDEIARYMESSATVENLELCIGSVDNL